MAHASLPKLLCKPVNTSKMCPSDFTTTLSDVLQSDPVKRLFNQPNIIIKTIPLNLNATSASNNDALVNHKTNNIDSNINKTKQSELSVIPLQGDEDAEDREEDENLLPSKKQGKSEITLVPIKREKKACGHYEPCENIICDVAVQQYVDRDGSSPMLAVNIDESEINAPVSKHCSNELCDALSIDHDRCRRAVIRLNRCNQSSACDICGIALKTQRSRVHHKNCTRKNEYRHNDTNSAQILRERMREREIQIMEALKTKRNDYMDPITGYNLAMEALRKNDELIVIPKSISQQQQQQQQQQPTITISPMPTTQSTQQINSLNNVFGKILPNIPIVLPQQGIVLGKTQCSNDNSIATPIQLTLSDTLARSLITTTSTVPLSQNQYLTFTTQTGAHPIPINDLLLPQAQIMTTPIQPKPLLTPIRVVPITNLITQPSLLHQTQGIPKFCIMPDNTAPLLTITNPQPIQCAPSVPKLEPRSELKAPSHKKKRTVIKKKRKFKRKEFKCEFCLKSFSTDWYFKMHVAMHTGEKRFVCKICKQSFDNRYDLKRHAASHRENESGDQQTAEDLHKCADCNVLYVSEDSLEQHRQEFHDDMDTSLANDPSNFVEVKMNNVESQQEARKEDKANGYGCMPAQDLVKNMKQELCHEV